MSTIGADRSQRLPPLRQDLQIQPSAAAVSGEKAWVIYDPLQHRFIQIDEETKHLLSIWREGLTIVELLEAAKDNFGLSLHETDAERLVVFVRRNNLAVEPEPDQWKEVYKLSRLARQSWWQQLVHNYLFFKIPLVRPQRWLDAALPLVAPLYSRVTGTVVGVIGLLGLYLVSRQWEAFLATFPNFFTFEGAAAFALSLMFVKVLHELGHAFTAVRFGCHVSAMGVAFMMMTPMLYTDVSDAWRITDRRKRLIIDSAGIIVELALACLATALWVFLPDGIGRSIAFVVSTTGWILSLGVNLNPFMRFDGYYILCDIMRIDNLQPRAFALGRWKLREVLFAPAEECPETLPAATRRWMIGYAWATWLYRLVIFTGIALVVYGYFFKVIGIVLFAVEIWYFIARPIVSELKEWKKARVGTLNIKRTLVTACCLITLIGVLVIPWSTSIAIPAVLEATDTEQIYPPRAAKITSIEVERGQELAAGAVIVQLTSPEIEHQIAVTSIKIDGTKLRLARTVADPDDREERLVLLHELDSLNTQMAGLLREQQEMAVRTPIAGTLLEIDPHLHVGQWLAKSDMIGLIGPRQKIAVRGYVAEADVGRLETGSTGTFVPDDLNRPAVSVALASVAPSGATAIELPILASVYGGRIAVEQDAQRRLVPMQSYYLVEMLPRSLRGMPGEQVIRGVVRMAGAPESLLWRTWQQFSRVLIRETGF